MKYLLIIAVLFSACSSKKENIENDLKAYLEKEYRPSMNDPKSYEYVSMKIDTINGSVYDAKKSLDILNNNSLPKSTILSMVDSIKAHPSKADSIYCYDIDVTLRGNNSFGAKILNNESVRYYPAEKRFER